MGAKKALKLSVSLIFLAGTGIFFLSGTKQNEGAKPEYLIGRPKVEMSAGRYAVDESHLNAIISARDIPMLDYFTNLEYADFSGSTCYDEINLWAAANPDVEVKYSIPMPNGSAVDSGSESLDLSWLEKRNLDAAAKAAAMLPNLKHISLGAVGGDGLELADLAKLSEAAPNASFEFNVELMGKEISSDAESIDLSALRHSNVADTAALLSCMKNLKNIDLGSQSAGSDLDWADLAALKAACPEARFSYAFTLYGVELDLDIEMLDFRGNNFPDKGEALMAVMPLMNGCKYLDLDETGMSNEDCAKLRELCPETEVVWRVWFGKNYSVRTDTERILASKPTVGGMLSDASVLQYCTKVKYLDLGHNDELADFSFVAKMPDLEVLIISMTAVTDISPLSGLSKLDYLELNSTEVSDLSPIAGCTAIKHLNIGSCPNITDISPLYGITGMERFWIGSETPVPAEQVKEMKAAAPGCNINTTTYDPHGECWRYTGYDPEIPLYYWVPRYELIREQLGYNYQEYSFYWLDPLCDKAAPAEHAGKYGKEVYGL